MRIGIAEILAVLCVIFFLFAAVGIFLVGMWTNSLYTKEYRESQGSKLTEQWAWASAGMAALGVVAAFFVWFTAKSFGEYLSEKHLAKDEREKTIRLRSTAMAYSLLMGGIWIVALFEFLTDGPLKYELFGLMAFGILSNVICVALNKYILR
jgi:hypothetical protein